MSTDAATGEVENLTSTFSRAAITVEDDDDDDSVIEGIEFVDYKDESQLESVMELVGRDLSEPYSSTSRPVQSCQAALSTIMDDSSQSYRFVVSHCDLRVHLFT